MLKGRGKKSEEPDSRLEAVVSLWVTSYPSTALGEAAVPGPRCLPAGALASHHSSADWQELTSLGRWLTHQLSAMGLEEPAGNHRPAQCGPSAVPCLCAMPPGIAVQAAFCQMPLFG